MQNKFSKNNLNFDKKMIEKKNSINSKSDFSNKESDQEDNVINNNKLILKNSSNKNIEKAKSILNNLHSSTKKLEKISKCKKTIYFSY